MTDTSAGRPVSPGKPMAYLLAGLTGSGKTTLARSLEASGVARLSVDEEVFAVTARMLDEFIARFEPPDNEGEEIIRP
jgi:dephospho-CoA kinase